MATAKIGGVACGAGHSAAVIIKDSHSKLFTWGRGEDGQLGLGDALDRSTPTEVPPLNDGGGEETVEEITAGAEHTLAKTTSGVFAWGWGDFGRLGLGAVGDVFVPKQIPKLHGVSVKQMSCGDFHCLAVLEDGSLWAFGRNSFGQLGLGNTGDVLEPTRVESLSHCQIMRTGCGAEHSVAADCNGRVFSFGWGRYGNLGNGKNGDKYTPELIQGALRDKAVRHVSCGWRHTCVVTYEGELWTFGWDEWGQLGHGKNKDVWEPEKVAYFEHEQVIEVQGGWRHTAVITEDGTLYTMGWNRFGQLGVGDLEPRNLPTNVLLPKRADKVACGWRHTLVALEDASLWSFGHDGGGQLGLGSSGFEREPSRVTALDAYLMNQPAGYEGGDVGQEHVSARERYSVVPESRDETSVRKRKMSRLSEGEEDFAVPPETESGHQQHHHD